ncbi:G protein-activated inward rectifier potassium channel 3-like [Lingula anatina]|uniref:G protein-activated inward rectifier potassium channel 3-like n=1 Tax=Lingula anatina TaxID=7574 RepID=A0A1S3IVB2_LINAN|nr:G protein-activated inward rectifier potassium channel 3-like [Lingula anatina]|eukprot:XP_013401886.1 G protein-activated inward rectifier potassium channel 3-like [Lingula anatina]
MEERGNDTDRSRDALPLHDLGNQDTDGLNNKVKLDDYNTYNELKDPYQQFAARSQIMSPNGPLLHRGAKSYSKRMRRRLVYKNGECNISHTNIKKLRRRYLADIFTTLIDIKWRYSLMIFVLGFVLSWLVFAMVWWLIAFSHGDIEAYQKGDSDWKPCVNEVYSFTTALLFSVETQHTIGYGSRHTTASCPEAIIVMMMQSCFGVIVQAMMTGIVFAKLARPKKRAETLMFSKNAVICKRDGQLCLLFRVGDMRKSHIVEAHVRAAMIKKKLSKEGEVMPLHQFDINLGFDAGLDRLFLVWPLIVTHVIDENSPFWKISAEDLYRDNFELIVILEGIVESTGMTTQARSSYLPGEILWGHRFERLVTFQKENGEYQVDYSRFHNTVPVDTPTCSAKELAEMGDEDEEDTGYNGYMDGDDSSSTSEATISSRTSHTPLPSPYILKKNGCVQTTDHDFADDLEPIARMGSIRSSGGNDEPAFY